jgi:hypothetical protein
MLCKTTKHGQTYLNVKHHCFQQKKFPFCSWIQFQILITLLQSVSRLHLCNSKSSSRLLHYCDQNICSIIDNKYKGENIVLVKMHSIDNKHDNDCEVAHQQINFKLYP